MPVLHQPPPQSPCLARPHAAASNSCVQAPARLCLLGGLAESTIQHPAWINSCFFPATAWHFIGCGPGWCRTAFCRCFATVRHHLLLDLPLRFTGCPGCSGSGTRIASRPHRPVRSFSVTGPCCLLYLVILALQTPRVASSVTRIRSRPLEAQLSFEGTDQCLARCHAKLILGHFCQRQ